MTPVCGWRAAHFAKPGESISNVKHTPSYLRILQEKNGSVGDCVAEGFDQQTAQKVAEHLFNNQPRKNRSAPGPRVTASRPEHPYPAHWRDG